MLGRMEGEKRVKGGRNELAREVVKVDWKRKRKVSASVPLFTRLLERKSEWMMGCIHSK